MKEVSFACNGRRIGEVIRYKKDYILQRVVGFEYENMESYTIHIRCETVIVSREMSYCSVLGLTAKTALSICNCEETKWKVENKCMTQMYRRKYNTIHHKVNVIQRQK